MKKPAVWFPTVKTNSGSDKFTECLVENLNKSGIHAEITWLPHHAEYLPWLVKVPTPPKWANITHINTWLHPRFSPNEMPIVATLHHCVQDPNFKKYKTQAQFFYHNLWITPIEKYNLNKARIITTVSQYTANCAKEIFNIRDIKVIYNGINTNIFYLKDPIKNFKNEQIFKLLFVGNSSIRKGFDLLPKIMEKLGDQYQLFYTSDAKNYHPLPQNMIQLEHQKTAEDLVSIYREMDALLFPSRLEGFGLVVAEAMSCGLPVITTDGSALTELINHRITGLLCPRDDVNSFVETIQQLACDELLKKNLAHNSSQYAEKNFKINHMVEKYIQIYNQILSYHQYE